MTKLHPDTIKEIAREVADTIDAHYTAQYDVPVTAPAACADGGFIYFLRCDAPHRPVKIGWTTDIARRLKSIRSGNPFGVHLLAFYWASRPLKDEAELHVRFRRSRMRGEWFRSTREIESLIEVVRSTLQASEERP